MNEELTDLQKELEELQDERKEAEERSKIKEQINSEKKKLKLIRYKWIYNFLESLQRGSKRFMRRK